MHSRHRMRTQYLDRVFGCFGAADQIIRAGAEVTGQMHAAGFCVIVGQAGRGIGWGDHQHAGPADDWQCALRRAGTAGADDAQDSRVGRQSLRSCLAAFCRTQAVFDHQLDFATQQHAATRINRQFDATLRIQPKRRVCARNNQHGADHNRIVRAQLDAAQRIFAG